MAASRHIVLKFLRVCLLLGALASAPCCAADAAAVARIASSVWVADVPTKVAQALGLFEAERTTASREPIRMRDHDAGLQGLDALLRGEAEFALTTNTPFAVAVLRQRQANAAAYDDLVVLASIALTSGSHFIVGSSARGVRAPADLVGRRIGVMFGTATHFGWAQFARLHGIADGTVTLVDLPVDQLGEALLAGDLDAVVLWEPFVSQLNQALGADAVLFSTQAVQTVNWLLVTRRATVQQRGALVERVLRAYQRAIAFVIDQPARAWEIHARATGVPLAQIERMQGRIAWDLALDWSVLANLEAQFDWLVTRPSFSASAKPLPPDYLAAEPLARLAPARVKLPAFLARRAVEGPPRSR